MPGQMRQASGKYGVVAISGDTVSTVRNWMVNNIADTKPFVASNTKGGHGRRRGYMDWNGSFEQYSGWPDLGVMPGETFDFIGYVAPRSGSWGGIGPTVTGAAICDSIKQVINWKTGDIILTTYTFSGNGELYSAGDQIFHDDSPIEALSSSRAASPGIWYGPGESMESIELCCEQATLTITSDNKVVMNSCGDGFMKREAGNIDWRVEFVVNEPDASSLVAGSDSFVPNKYVGIQLYVDPTDHWVLEWGLIKEFSNFTVNRETGDIINYTIPIEMSIDNGEDTENDGIIKRPGASENWWPETEA